MYWFGKLRRQKLFSISMLGLTAALTILLGTVLTTGVSAARGQSTAPDATPLTIPPVKKMENEFTKIAKMLEPSVVFITTETVAKKQQTSNRRRPQAEDDEEGFNPFRGFGMPFGNEPPRRREGSGSGFIVDKNGYILTNMHVVDGADKIKVKLYGERTEYSAKLIGSDPETDVAVLKIDAGKALPPVKIANSDSVQPGDWSVAIGAPFGLETTVTAGIVSATGRDIAAQFQRFIQTDAAINPGNSGGPLVNINGEVIGINTMIATSSGANQGIGFALPVNMAAKVYNQIIQTGRVSRGSIGIRFPRQGMEDILKADGFKNGVIIDSVKPGGPADKAGLKSEDILMALNGKPIKDGDDLVNRVSDMPAGTEITISLDRRGQKMDKKVVIEERDKVFSDEPQFARNKPEMVDPEGAGENSARFGIGIRPITEDQRKEMELETGGGVMVTTVEEGSFAEDIGMRARDVILSINRQPVSTFEDVKSIQARLKPGDTVAFRVMRAAGVRRSGQAQWVSVYLSGTMPK